MCSERNGVIHKARKGKEVTRAKTNEKRKKKVGRRRKSRKKGQREKERKKLATGTRTDGVV